MLDGVMLLWFLLTALSLLFVVIDIRATPASPVLKWGFILLTAYLGPLGAFLYVFGCREPLTGLHERYVATRWRQVLGSTMHCVAGDVYCHGKHAGKPRPIRAGILVHHVHGASGGIHHRVSDELVVGITTHEARHDDGAITGRYGKRWNR